MTPLQTNKPVFFDGDTPLNGTIYVGQPGTDPRTNPKTVTFQDSGGSQFTAAQPLNVSDGKVVYNGKPIVALVDGEYSALLFDIGGKQVDYIRAFDPSGGATGSVDFSEVTRTGLTLDEVKAFDVAVGDVVENVGKVTAQDGLGAKWIAVSPTGSAADDVTLIDFTNGLQGQKITSKPDYQETTVDLGGDFASGSNVKITRNGSQVTVCAVQFLSYTAGTASASSAAGIIPEWARPTGTASNSYYFLGGGPAVFSIRITSSGTVTVVSNRTDTGGSYSSTTSGTPPLISYNI